MINNIPSWITWIGILSLAMFLAALAFLPLIIKKVPRDIFLYDREKKNSPLFLHLLQLILRNMAGLVLVFAGIVMLFIPGQGLLTIMAGLFFLTFPGKRLLMNKIISLKYIQTGLNRFRKKMGEAPFIFPSSL